MRFIVTAGHVGNAVLANASDSNALRETIAGMGAKAVIPTDRWRKTIIPHDKFVYGYRNCIERCFNSNAPSALPLQGSGFAEYRSVLEHCR